MKCPYVELFIGKGSAINRVAFFKGGIPSVKCFQ
jgi:hypothetical protein